MQAIWLTAWLLPAAAAVLAMGSRPTWGRALMPVAMLPAAILALWPTPPDPVVIDWLLLEVELGLDALGRTLLAMTALLWLAATWYSRTYMRDAHGRRAYWGMFGICATGNFGLLMAQDLVTFYMAFAVMTLAGYALVMHRNDSEARHAGAVYIVMAIFGELMLVAGLMLAAHAAGGWAMEGLAGAVAESPRRDLIVVLIFAGFGVKAGALGLHMWLPLAHPAAPTPASAVLSGTMIKAGLLGWLRVLPVGEAALPVGGGAVMALGLTGALLGVAAGLTQVNPKTVLAYSSVSQMGLMTLMLGMAMTEPDLYPLVGVAIGVYALHHGLAKGALFLGVGVARGGHDRPWQRWVLRIGLVLPAAALAGMPFTSGQVAKAAMKEMTPLVAAAWQPWLNVLVPATAVATTVLMGRFLWLIWPRQAEEPASRQTGQRETGEQDEHHHPHGPGMWHAWLAVVVLATLAVWVGPAYLGLEAPALAPWTLYEIWSAAYPVGIGVLAVVVALRIGPSITLPWVPAGDVVWIIQSGLGFAGRGWRRSVVPVSNAVARRTRARWNRLMLKLAHWTGRVELRLTRWATAGTLFALLVLILVIISQWNP